MQMCRSSANSRATKTKRKARTRWLYLGLSLMFALQAVAWSSGDDHDHNKLLDSARRRFAHKGTKPKYARHRPYLIKHVRLELKVLPRKKYIEGNATLTITPFGKAISSITLDAAELNIQSVFVAGKKAQWTAEGNKLDVTFAAPLKVSKTVLVRINYNAKPRSGLHFILPSKAYPNKPVMVYSQGESTYNRFWFPTFDSTNMRFTSETLITVPKPLMVIANGKLVKKTEKGQFVTYHHVMKFNHATYLLSIVIGQFSLFKQEWRGIPVLSYSPVALADRAKRSFENTVDMLEFFSNKIGFDYPYSKYAQVAVHDFIAGGMENITATTLNHQTLHDARAHLTRKSDGLIAHELAHQWFGDLLTCKDWSHLWLNESFATYFAQLYYEHKWGKDAFAYQRKRSLGWYFHTGYQRAIQTRLYEHPSDMFDSHTYPKGAAVLHMIRRKLGDRLWWKGIQLYVTTHAHGLVETSDLRRAFEKVSGFNLESFFDQWIHSPGHPVVHYSWRYLRKNKQIRVTIVQKQRRKAYAFDTKLNLSFGKSQRVIAVHIAKKRHTFLFSVTSRPKMVELDAEGDILMKLKAKKSRQQWRYQLLHGSSTWSRWRAAKRLGKYPNAPKVFAALKQVLNDKKAHYSLRAAVVGALSKIGSDEACQFLLVNGINIEDARVRKAVAAKLSHCKDQKTTLDALITLMRLDPSYGVRSSAIGSIGRLRHKRSFKLLTEALGQTFDYGRVQASALRALATLETPKAIPFFQKAMALGQPLRVRLAAMGLYAASVARFHKKKKATHYLRIAAHLKDPHPWIRGTAIRALTTLGDWRALPLMRRFASQAALWTTTRRVKRAIQRLYKRTKTNKKMRLFGRDLEKLRKMHKKVLKRLKRLEKQRAKRK